MDLREHDIRYPAVLREAIRNVDALCSSLDTLVALAVIEERPTLMIASLTDALKGRAEAIRGLLEAERLAITELSHQK